MANTITVKIDVRKLDKARFFEGKADANGHRPLYADLVLIPRKEVGKFGDTHIVKQSLKKEEREAGQDLPILGSATERGNSTPKPAQAPAPTAPAADTPAADEDVPF